LTSFRARLSAWGKLGALLLFPSSCELCGALLVRPGEKVVCRDCLAGLRMTPPPFCLCCGRFFDGSGESHLCGVCLERRPSFTRHRSAARYGGAVKDVILLYKYRGFEVLARGLGDFIIRSLGQDEGLWAGVEAIVPVPLHPRKERSRGFNQARLLARRLAQRTNIPLLHRHLVKVRPTPAQTSLEARDREANLKGGFRVKRPSGLAGKVVLLVDDVCTTGSTLRECSKALRQSGVKEVRAVTVARA
jgi:competence protein ComFC